MNSKVIETLYALSILIILIFLGFAAGVRTMIKTAKEIDANIRE